MNTDLSAFAMTDVSVHTASPNVRFRPHLGLFADINVWKGLWYAGFENTRDMKTIQAVWGEKVQRQLANDFLMFLGFERNQTSKGAAELRWFW